MADLFSDQSFGAYRDTPGKVEPQPDAPFVASVVCFGSAHTLMLDTNGQVCLDSEGTGATVRVSICEGLSVMVRVLAVTERVLL